MRKMMNLENNIDQICNELALKIEALRGIIKTKSQRDIVLRSTNTEINEDKKRESLKRTVREAILELEETKKHFKSKTIKEVREKLIRALEG